MTYIYKNLWLELDCLDNWTDCSSVPVERCKGIAGSITVLHGCRVGYSCINLQPCTLKPCNMSVLRDHTHRDQTINGQKAL